MVLAESSFDSSSSIGVAIGFVFHLAGGSVATSCGSLEAGGALIGARSAGSDGGPCGGGRVLKTDAGCQNRLRCGEA